MSSSPNFKLFWLFVAICEFTVSIAWAEPPRVAELLGERVMEPGVTLAELQRYVEPRIAELPEFASVDEWEAYAAQIRRDMLARVIFRGEAANWRDAECRVEWGETIPGGPGYHLRKVRYEALPGLWIPAVLYEPDELAGKLPVVLNVNGHDGAGKAAPYKQLRCINEAKRGMLALNVEWLGMGQLRTDNFTHYKMNQLDLCGTSGLAPFYLAMARGLDLLLSLPHADPERVAVAGLSGGGWQTIYISSLDPRVTASNPVAGYSSFRTRLYFFSDLGDSEQTPTDMGTVADYAHLTALRAPRPTLLTYNAEDNCCFKSGHALAPLIEAAEPIFALYGREKALTSHVNHDPGTHNFERENREAFYKLLADSFATGSAGLDAQEIPSDDELKTADELMVELPPDNADFNTLALALASTLPQRVEAGEGRDGAEQWQTSQREQLANIVRFPHYQTMAHEGFTRRQSDVTARYWRLKLGDDWTVPAVELSPAKPKATVVVVADNGRASAAARIEELLEAGTRVVTVDPFYFGESKIGARDHLMALTLATVGKRPLGLQAGQIAATARWLASREKDQGVKLIALGPRMSTIALVAAALETEAISSVELDQPLGSLKEVIENNSSVDREPELFCFGLLERFDICDLAALVAPRPVAITGASDRVRQELADLPAWYGRWSAEFGPVQ